MKKTRIKEAVVGVAAGIALTVMGGTYVQAGIQPDQKTVSFKDAGSVGRITPVNLRSGPAKFSSAMTQQDCCGPQAQSCPSFQCAAPY